MKKLIRITVTSIVILLFNQKAIAQDFDTLQRINSRIINKKSLFIEKPLRVLLDSLKKNNLKVKEYSGANDIYSGTLSQFDTIWVSEFTLYFDKVLDSERMNQFLATKTLINRTKVKLGIKGITVYLKNPIYFLSKWIDMDRRGLASNNWNLKVEMFYRKCIVKDIEIYEF